MYCLGFALEGTLVIVDEITGTVNEISSKVIIRNWNDVSLIILDVVIDVLGEINLHSVQIY